MGTRKLLRLIFPIVLTSLAAHGEKVPDADRNYQERKQEAFLAYNAHYLDQRAERIQRTVVLAKRLFRLERLGENVACAHQIFVETKWLLGATADFTRIDQRLDALERVLDHPDLENAATQQDPSDGSWGRCYTEWFFKLDATYDHLDQDSTRNVQPPVPLTFLDRVNSPEKLKQYFDGVMISNIARDGVDHSRELNESMADLMRFILTARPKGYSWDPHLKPALMEIILHRLRNPETGWWGERYVFNGKVDPVDYLSLTFHIVRYLNGDVPEMRRVVETTLDVKDRNDPAGWLTDNHFTDHNNMDVAVLFRFGWKAATLTQRRAMAEEIQKMLRWCLTKSLQADGSFAGGGDDSVEENTYFGAAFLSRIGFFDRRRRFWTKREFPEAPEIRQRITRFINQHRSQGAVGGTYYENALRELHSGGDSDSASDSPGLRLTPGCRGFARQSSG